MCWQRLLVCWLGVVLPALPLLAGFTQIDARPVPGVLCAFQSHAVAQVTLAEPTRHYYGLGRRWKATLQDDSYWQYGYNDRNEVVSGKHYRPNGSPFAGQQSEFGYDNIGNRDYAYFGGNASGGNLRYQDYTANSLNQYGSIVTPGYQSISGMAWADTNVVVISGGVTNAASRQDSYFSYELPLANSGPVCQPVTVQAGGQSSGGNLLFPPYQRSPISDLDGNLISDGLWTNRWDAKNRLISIESLSTVPALGRKHVEFGYDYMDRRVWRKIYNDSGTFTNHTLFLYDGWNLIAELDGTTKAPVRSYLWGLDLSGTLTEAGGIGGLVVQRDHRSGSYHFPSYDGHGNIVALVNAADQSLSAQYEYGSFGELIRSSGPMARANPFRFSTKYYDQETDLIYFGQRYYSPSLGRFLSPDPIGTEGGLNLYAFVGKNADLDAAMAAIDALNLFGNSAMALNIWCELVE